ncbi:hypothetical protein BJ138DRAFT_1130197 [Hygrophoropsis aurantiaca]|uniref:Uncharacterized protein n=1 Tax=Hygrophoropsis aurantiaca TaxID=72124 RepID=A0ACB7ZZ39_9AGAM|nr:hypothetical protein BJ138DRAFT_1130197 [Hygrophoropsis aurantiaca]
MSSRIKKRKPESQANSDQETALARQELETFGTVLDKTPGALNEGEKWWCERYQWLKDCGYILRSRYAPDWVPSWHGTDKNSQVCVDGVIPRYNHLMDAIRISDGTDVILKSIKKSRHPFEAEIGKFFTSEPLMSDPANHCVPIFEVLSVPENDDRIILVMPMLRAYSDPRFDTVGEVVDCIHQLFEGLRFMHSHHVAHRDCMKLNILMDATSLYPESFNPWRSRWTRDLKGYAKHLTRTRRPPKYYFIDFGISRRYSPSDSNPREPPIRGGDRSVPEFQGSDEPQNPFPTDVYYLGNVLREDFIQSKMGLSFLDGLVADMVQGDPSKRPAMNEVVVRFEGICKGLSSWKLRSRVADKNEGIRSRLIRDAGHWTRRLISIARGHPPVPKLKPSL